MHILLADDEDGIREGLASFLRLKGRTVRTAASLAEALEAIAAEEFDAILSDWHLGDGTADALIDAARDCPVLVVSGYPEEVVRDRGNLVGVLPKPLSPMDADAELGQIEAGTAESYDEPVVIISRPEGDVIDLPVDAQARVELVALWLEVPRSALEIHSDDNLLTVCCVPTNVAVDLGGLRAATGGDPRLLGTGSDIRLELTFHRDGRPEGLVHAPFAPDEPWLEGEIAVDFHGHTVSPGEFLDCVDRARGRDEPVHLLNVPAGLRLLVEASGRRQDLPMRVPAGPSLPEPLARLWS